MYIFSKRDPVYLESKAKRGSEAKDHQFALQTNDQPGQGESKGTSGSPGAGTGYISMQEVGQHHLAHDAWVVVDGKVYE
jgi:hypothetical protein